MKKIKVPCWVCKGSGIIEEGETIDVGIGWGIEEQVSPDIECEWCDYGMIEIGSKKHKEYRKYAQLTNKKGK